LLSQAAQLGRDVAARIDEPDALMTPARTIGYLKQQIAGGESFLWRQMEHRQAFRNSF
jgi:hypothetical protein